MPHLSIAIAILALQFPYHFAAENEWISSSYLTLFRRVLLFGFYIQIALYIFASLVSLNDYKLKLEDKFSNLDRINLAWLKRLIFILAVLIAIDMITTVPGVILQTDLPYFTALMIAESTTIYLLGYFSLTHHEVIFQKEPISEQMKYESSPLDGELSVINEQYQMSFYEYVNSFRVEFAEKLLREKADGSIADIATESGFNNRASFNNYFKKQTGLTPSKYRQQHRSAELNSLNVKA